MSARRTLNIDMNGEPAEVIVTQVTPGRWSWSIRREGQAPIGSATPLPTGQAAMKAALDEVRRAGAHPQTDKA